jgi:hypothetical protein
MSDETPKRLSNKHLAFIDEYFRNRFNGTRAYLSVYGGKETTARANAAELLTKTSIKTEISSRMAELHMSADEAMQILEMHARGDVARFMDLSSVGWNVSLIQLDDDGHARFDDKGNVIPKPETRLIKKLKQRVTTIIGKGDDGDDKEIVETEIELYDAQQAARDILKMHGKFKESDSENKVIIEIKYADNGNRNDTDPTR